MVSDSSGMPIRYYVILIASQAKLQASCITFSFNKNEPFTCILNKVIIGVNEKPTKSGIGKIGKVTWGSIILFFIISGLGILGIPVIKEYYPYLLITASVLAIVAYIIFFDVLNPTPYNWILGIVIDIVLILYVAVYPKEGVIFIPLLLMIAVLGMIWIFTTEFLPNISKITNT